MSKVIAIGEALIDFIPTVKGQELKNVESFTRVPGGAPLNVVSAVCKLGGDGIMLTKLGQDAFGDIIIDTVKPLGVDISRILRTSKANTALAFVSLKENGERDFSFYRNPSADMLLAEEEIVEDDFKPGDILHFCSVSLIDAPIKNAHRKAIEFAKNNNCIVSFDPNIRLPLWESPEKCREAILEFLPLANIVKVSDEELEFITGIKDEKEAINSLFVGSVNVVIYTKGVNGAEFITSNNKYFAPSYKVEVEDTTGAGDSFIGAILYKISSQNITLDDLVSLDKNIVENILDFANRTAAITVSRKGAIGALPTFEEVEKMLCK
ncbi:carbohydrate kinase [Clostridium sp. NSJ-6]|uniref:Carbohydrate kinase n=1 Tax=Clostridium hominis TaxID=2763036 RepID=A0ABR7DB73_9CLOT|nr:carbohydrate kinase [Clostridium hominis]MBC5628128.1 carbohydrate kinase [Clostridium hominis]MDU2673113.1 carbohydrate kinase [Clostridium sp.]